MDCTFACLYFSMFSALVSNTVNADRYNSDAQKFFGILDTFLKSINGS